jgi:hypothetical protein
MRTWDISVLGYCPFKTSKYLLSPLPREEKERTGEEVSQQNENFGAFQFEATVPLRLHIIFFPTCFAFLLREEIEKPERFLKNISVLGYCSF